MSRRTTAVLMGAVALAAGVAVAIGLGYAVGGDPDDPIAAAPASTAPAPTTSTTRAQAPATETAVRKTTEPVSAETARPVVWIQAGHVPPGEPGYRAQTGSAGEAAFNTRVRDAVVTLLRRQGLDARPLGARVDPLGASGAAFVSIHHDSPGGPAALGYAVQGNENYYRGEGFGTASPTPYSDSAPHRKPATVVTPRVQAASKRLAESVATTFKAVYTPGNGANGRFTGVQSPGSSRRMMNFYGYYRTNADARMLIECGSQSNDAAFLRNTRLVSRAIAGGIVNYLNRGASAEVPLESSGVEGGRKPALASKGG